MKGARLGGGWVGRHTSPLSLIFSSSLYGAYHFASRVLPLRPPLVSYLGVLRLSVSAARGTGRGDLLAILYEYEGQHLGRVWAQLKMIVATLKLRGLGDAAPSRDILAWVPPSQRRAAPELGRGRGQPCGRGEGEGVSSLPEKRHNYADHAATWVLISFVFFCILLGNRC